MIAGKQYTLADVAGIAKRRKWLVVAPLAVASIATFLFVRTLPNRFRSETLILVVPQRVPESYVKSTVTARIEDRLQSISQQILSRTRLERIILDFNLYAAKRRSGIMEDIVEQMRKDIDVQVIKGDAFRVSYAGDEPRTVMQVTQRLATLFIDENLRDRETLAEGSYQFIEAQLVDARRRLVEHERRLEEYRRRYAGQLPTQFQSNLQMIQNTQIQIQVLTEAMARDRDRRLMVERAIADAAVGETVIAPAPALAAPSQGELAAGTAAQQLVAARQMLRQLELRLKPEHPDIGHMHRLIANLTQKAGEEAARPPDAVDKSSVSPPSAGDLAREHRLNELRIELSNLDRQLARREQDEKQLRQVVSEYQARLEATPARESELTELMRDYAMVQQAYTSLLGKKEESRVAANLERNQIGEQFKVLDPARLPEKPESPNRTQLNLLGAAVGLALGIGLTLLLEMMDSTLKTADDVRSALALPVLALVPLIIATREETHTKRRRLLITLAAMGATAGLAGALLIWKFGLAAAGV